MHSPPHTPCPLKPVSWLPFLSLRLWCKISFINIWKIEGLGCRCNKPMTLACRVFENAARTWPCWAGDSQSTATACWWPAPRVLLQALAGCERHGAWPWTCPRSGRLVREILHAGHQSQSQDFVLTISSVSHAYMKF